ncbi:integrator complex subunit 6-like isoform X2 [Babylonia areolata]|uniref:integrator complex subunit 6-like isoform X2 n=1 Tax=Babylonia areolata TaxID=304850 RepID=UPI003FD69E12
MMTIILFLVDTSASMNQRTYLGTTMLDVAKAAVETFMKIRARDPNSRWDRYMLLTFEDPPANVKAGWKESAVTFTAELKNLKAGGLTTMGPSIKNAFDLLNLFRMQSGVDTYGQGRCPFFLESAVIIVITDGGILTTHSSVSSELNLPMNTSVVPGSELTKEPFRWDQRVFGLVLRLPASVPPDVTNFPFIPSAENSPIDVMCEVTGGRSYAVYSQKMINGALESLVQKVHSGVVISFEKFGPDPPPTAEENQDMNRQNVDSFLEEKKFTSSPMSQQAPAGNSAWHSCRRLIYVPRSASKGQFTGHWPIPEGFWPDNSSPTLTPRTAHPVVRFSCAPVDPMVIENIPFDKYELEPSPLTQYILERRQPNICWQTFVANSGRFCDQSLPFGYLKASSSLTAVNLFVMPYNYPVLLPLLDELFKVHKLKPTPQWREKFEKYLKSMPGYYAVPLRRALGRMGAPNLIPENIDTCLSYSVITYLKKLKNQAKVEMDRMNASVGQKIPLNEGIAVNSRTKTSILQRRDFSQLLSSIGGNLSALKQEMTSDYSAFHIAVPDPAVRPQCYRNPYDILRKNLLDQVTRMRKNLLQTSHTAQTLMEQEERHNVPVQQMGNYQEQLKKQPPALRPIDNQPARLHMFGNPFKVNKQNMMVDEAEDALFGNQSLKRKTQEAPASPGPDRKRKPGPLPRNVPYKVLASPRRSPPPEDYYPSDEEDIISVSDGESRLAIDIDDSTDDERGDSMNKGSTTPSSAASLSPTPAPSPGGGVTRQTPTSCLTNHNHTGGGSGVEGGVGEREVSTNGESELSDMVNSGGPNNHHHHHHHHHHHPPVRPGGAQQQGKNNVMTVVNSTNNVNSKEVWKFNSLLRVKVCKEVKKPGKDFSSLFKQLSTVQGSLEVRRAFVRGITQEAMRFKRKALVALLKQFEDSMLRGGEQNKSRGRSCVS